MSEYDSTSDPHLKQPANTLPDIEINLIDLARELVRHSRLGLDDIRNARDIYELLLGCEDNTGGVQEYILRHSREGIISDPNSNPQCMDPTNIGKVAAAMLTAANSAEAGI